LQKRIPKKDVPVALLGEHMHTLDIFFCIAAVFFIVVGVRRGLIGELFRLLALVFGFIVAFLYYPDLARLFRISSSPLSTPVCF
jgi:uncharacterized membrane protein required for colicin V production